MNDLWEMFLLLLSNQSYAIRIKPLGRFFISMCVNLGWQIEQQLPWFPKMSNKLPCILKLLTFSKAYWEFPFHLNFGSLCPEFWVIWFVFPKFIKLQLFGQLQGKFGTTFHVFKATNFLAFDNQYYYHTWYFLCKYLIIFCAIRASILLAVQM